MTVIVALVIGLLLGAWLANRWIDHRWYCGHWHRANHPCKPSSERKKMLNEREARESRAEDLEREARDLRKWS